MCVDFSRISKMSFKKIKIGLPIGRLAKNSNLPTDDGGEVEIVVAVRTRVGKQHNIFIFAVREEVGGK